MTYDDICSSNKPSEIGSLLRSALCAEWLAYYQYWWASVVVKGGNRSELSEHFSKHADEEKEHIDKIADRMCQLGVQPVFDPADLKRLTTCDYPTEMDNNELSANLLTQIIAAEACAVSSYKKLLTMLGNDTTTIDIIQQVLTTEEEHLFEMTREKETLEWMKNVYN